MEYLNKPTSISRRSRYTRVNADDIINALKFQSSLGSNELRKIIVEELDNEHKRSLEKYETI